MHIISMMGLYGDTWEHHGFLPMGTYWRSLPVTENIVGIYVKWGYKGDITNHQPPVFFPVSTSMARRLETPEVNGGCSGEIIYAWGMVFCHV